MCVCSCADDDDDDDDVAFIRNYMEVLCHVLFIALMSASRGDCIVHTECMLFETETHMIRGISVIQRRERVCV